MGYKTVGRFVYNSATAQAVAEGGNITYANNTTTNNCVQSAGQGIVRIEKAGLYNVFFNCAFEATAAGAVTAQLMHNGVAVPGAAGAVTLGAVGDLASVSFATPVTVKCCANDALNVVVNADTSVTIAALVVEKVA